jgi:hypothetical protein
MAITAGGRRSNRRTTARRRGPAVGSARSGRRSPGLDDQHGLAGRPRRRQAAPEARPVEKALDVHAQRRRPRLLDEVLEEVADVEVDLVAERHAVAEADAVAGGAVDDGHHQGPALAHQPDLAVGETIGVEHHRRAECQTMVRHDESHAVGPDQTHAAVAGDRDELGLARGSLVAGLGEAGRDDDAAADAGGGRLAYRGHQRRAGHRQDRDIGRRRRGGDGRVRASPKHLAAPWVDREDLAGEPVTDEKVHDASAELVLAVGGSEDGDRAGVQDALEVSARTHALPAQQGGVKSGRWSQGSACLLVTSETVRPHYIAACDGGTLRATEGRA